MTEHMHVLTQKGCIHCEELVDALKKQGKLAEVKLVPLETKEGMEAARKLKATGTPTPFIKDGEKLKECDFEYDKDGNVSFKCELPKNPERDRAPQSG